MGNVNCSISTDYGLNIIGYPHIDTVFKRDSKGKIIERDFSKQYFEVLYDKDCWNFTEKIDGTNVRLIWIDFAKSFIISGKTNHSFMPDFLFLKLKEITNEIKDNVYKIFSNNVIFFGEGYGNRIQSVGKFYIENNVDFILFDIYNIDKGFFYDDEYVREVAEQLNIKVVPSLNDVVNTLEEAVELTRNGFDSRIGNCKAEGIVAKHKFGFLNRMKERIITKIKHKDFV